jgi:hypothetical protein
MLNSGHYIVSIFKKTGIVVLVFWFNIFTPAFADDWSLKKNKNNLLIYTKSNPNSAFNLLKVVCDVDASASEMLSLIFDVSTHTKWVYNCVQSKVIKKTNDLNIYYYGETYAPWPVTNRDLVLHLTATQDSSTKIVTVKAISVPTLLPEVDGLVRVKQSESIWILTPIANGKLHIIYTLISCRGVHRI